MKYSEVRDQIKIDSTFDEDKLTNRELKKSVDRWFKYQHDEFRDWADTFQAMADDEEDLK